MFPLFWHNPKRACWVSKLHTVLCTIPVPTFKSQRGKQEASRLFFNVRQISPSHLEVSKLNVQRINTNFLLSTVKNWKVIYQKRAEWPQVMCLRSKVHFLDWMHSSAAQIPTVFLLSSQPLTAIYHWGFKMHVDSAHTLGGLNYHTAVSTVSDLHACF